MLQMLKANQAPFSSIVVEECVVFLPNLVSREWLRLKVLARRAKVGQISAFLWSLHSFVVVVRALHLKDFRSHYLGIVH